jgi:hypothetical protein
MNRGRRFGKLGIIEERGMGSEAGNPYSYNVDTIERRGIVRSFPVKYIDIPWELDLE